MAEFASKGVAGTGLALGIAGTTLGVLAGNNGGNGLLGGLLGNGGNTQAYQQMLMERDSKIAELEAQKYSDSSDIALYKQLKSEMNDMMEKNVTFIQSEMAKNQEIGELREKLTRSELGGQIAQVASNVNSGLLAVNGALQTLQATVANITKTVVPIGAVCPTPMAQYNSWTAPTSTSGS